MIKQRKTKVAKKRKLYVKKVTLPPAGIVHVEIPKDVTPMVATDTVKGVIEIIPVKREHKKKETWWDFFFGPANY